MDHKDAIRAKTPSCPCRYPRVLRITANGAEQTYTLDKQPTDAELEAIIRTSGLEGFGGTPEIRCTRADRHPKGEPIK